MVRTYSFKEVSDSTTDYVDELSLFYQNAFVDQITDTSGDYCVDSKYNARSPELPSYENNKIYLEYLERKPTHKQTCLQCLRTVLEDTLLEEADVDDAEDHDVEIYLEVKYILDRESVDNNGDNKKKEEDNVVENENQMPLKKRIKIEEGKMNINDEFCVISNILSNFDIIGLARVATVCRKWTDDNMWKNIYMQNWGKIVHPKRLEAIAKQNKSWREHCFVQYKWDKQQQEACVANIGIFSIVIDYLIFKILKIETSPIKEEKSEEGSIVNVIPREDCDPLNEEFGDYFIPAEYDTTHFWDSDQVRELYELTKRISIQDIINAYQPGEPGFPCQFVDLKTDKMVECRDDFLPNYLNFLIILKNAAERGNGLLRSSEL